jgi:uncharacterized membrane protein YkoI
MRTAIITLALAGFVAVPAAAQSATVSHQSSHAAQVNNKVSASLAASVRISADSAMDIARASAENGEVSSADLELKGKRLVYEVKVLNKSKRATEVTIDAMTGEVVKNKKYGGIKATVVHHKENKKLLDSKRDSAKSAPKY